MTEVEKALKNLIDNFSAYEEYQNYKAKLVKEYYDALIEEGFTKEQALELCKSIKL